MSAVYDVKRISVVTLKEWKDENQDIFILDVRNPEERDVCCLGGVNIPLGEIDLKHNLIPRDKKVVVHCRSGKRSQMAIMFLQAEHQFDNLYNLEGGIVNYAKIDETIDVY